LQVEEQPRKLEHVIRILNICLEKNDVTREVYAEQAQELVFNENILLQTLGFDVAIDHPHTHVVKACQLFNIVTGTLIIIFSSIKN
jgi:cyclin T